MTCAFVNPTSGYSTFSRFVSFRFRLSIWTSTDVSLATFSHHLAGLLVDSESLERRRAKLAAFGPFDELELGHDLRLHKVRGARWGCAGVERALVRGERLQQLIELVEGRV